jgi:FixJ family two-component response regulator
MLRVLLVLEDYGELMFLQTVLKKVGFDVDAIQNPRLFSDSLLSFNPEIVVMTAYGKRVKGLELSRTIKHVRGVPHVVLVRGAGQLADAKPDVTWIQTPIGATDLLGAIAAAGNLDRDVLNEKFQKLQASELFSEEQARSLKSVERGAALPKQDQYHGGSGTLVPSTLSHEERTERYKKFLADRPPSEHGFALKEVQQFVKTLRNEERQSDLEDLERERRAFVEHLFKRKPD